MKVKRDKRDDMFSKLVRERANHTCESCGKYCGPHHDGGRLDCSHIFSRRHIATRWHPDNAVAHCFTCHQRLGENPVEFNRWAEDFLGKGLLDVVEELKNSICKMTKADKEDLYKHLKAEYAAMLEKRADGDTSRIEFKAW